METPRLDRLAFDRDDAEDALESLQPILLLIPYFLADLLEHVIRVVCRMPPRPYETFDDS